MYIKTLFGKYKNITFIGHYKCLSVKVNLKLKLPPTSGYKDRIGSSYTVPHRKDISLKN